MRRNFRTISEHKEKKKLPELRSSYQQASLSKQERGERIVKLVEWTFEQEQQELDKEQLRDSQLLTIARPIDCAFRYQQFSVTKQIWQGRHYNIYRAHDLLHRSCVLKVTRTQHRTLSYHRQLRFSKLFCGRGRLKTKYGSLGQSSQVLLPLIKHSQMNGFGYLVYPEVKGKPLLDLVAKSKRQIVNEQDVISVRFNNQAKAFDEEGFDYLINSLLSLIHLFRNQKVVHAELFNPNILLAVRNSKLRQVVVLPSPSALVLGQLVIDGIQLSRQQLPSAEQLLGQRIEYFPPQVLKDLKAGKVTPQNLWKIDSWAVGIYLFQILTMCCVSQQIDTRISGLSHKGPLASCLSLSQLIRKAERLARHSRRLLKQRRVWTECQRPQKVCCQLLGQED